MTHYRVKGYQLTLSLKKIVIMIWKNQLKRAFFRGVLKNLQAIKIHQKVKDLKIQTTIYKDSKLSLKKDLKQEMPQEKEVNPDSPFNQLNKKFAPN